MRFVICLFSTICVLSNLTVANGQDSQKTFSQLDKFLVKNCNDCHSGSEAEAGLDLDQLKKNIDDQHTMKTWVRIYDRVASGEMPPKGYDKPKKEERQAFVTATRSWLYKHNVNSNQTKGRVRARRLTNLQLERSLHDLLGIDIPLANDFPEEQLTKRYSSIADAQPMSRFQLERHLQAVDKALDEAYRRTFSKKKDEFVKELDAKGIARKNPKQRNRDPEMLRGDAVVWSAGLVFYGRISATRVREPGWYRFTLSAKSLNSPKDYGVWCTLRSGQAISSAPLMNWIGAFETTKEFQEWTFEGWLNQGELFEVRPGDVTLKKARFRGGQVGAGEGTNQKVPGIAMNKIVIERFHKGASNWEIGKLLFPDLAIKRDNVWQKGSVESGNPDADLKRLIRLFAEQAFRRPVDDETVAPYLQIASKSLKDGSSFKEAVRVGYRSILCSPRFLYLNETPGKLDDYAVASRLSYFLWNSPPDKTLYKLAKEGKLSQPSHLSQQTKRMLKAPKGKEFIKDFSAEWLDLRLIDFTTPDRRLYGTFDEVTKNSMLDETHAYLQLMLDKNMSVTNLIDSDFTYLNSRLARFYRLPNVKGDELQKVSLAKNSMRGGLLGQGSILKVTANGTTTSPVVRGVWLLERVLGEEVPAPPANVPAIEPDIRGAKSIRDQLAKHRSIESCAACHKKIDPPGFALENFDAAGLWRDRYGKKGMKIDPSYNMATGEKFKNLNEFKALIKKNPEKLAHNLAEQLLMYGTGAPIGFADRKIVKDIAHKSAASNYGVETILELVIKSPLFLSK